MRVLNEENSKRVDEIKCSAQFNNALLNELTLLTNFLTISKVRKVNNLKRKLQIARAK